MSSIATAPQPLTYAGFPGTSWAYAIRIWLAVILALYVSFWLELDSPSSAAITVAILALPTRGQGLDKAAFRLMATTFGVAASFVIVGVFAQSGMILLWVFAVWIGVCVFVVGLLDGNRAYAASLGVTTVAIVAIEQIDTPQGVFDAGVARGSAIIVGVLAITLINDILGAPDHHTKMSARLESVRGRVIEYGREAQRGQVMPASPAADLLREITSLRPDIASLSAESSSGRARAASARCAMVGLVVEFSVMRALAALRSAAGGHAEALRPVRTGDEQVVGDDLLSRAQQWLADEIQQRDLEVRGNLAGVLLARFPERAWRTPLYRSRRIALDGGVKGAIYFILASSLFGMTDWPSVGLAVAFVALLIGLGSTAPDQGAFTKLAVLISPFACVLAGILQFVVLDGASGFPMLAVGLAPFVIVCALLMTLKSPILSSVGRLNMVFIIALVAPNNPQNYDPESFLVGCIFVCLSTGLLFALQMIMPPMAPERRASQLLAEARKDLDRPQSEWRAGEAMEEAVFRDALRVGQIASLAPDQELLLHEAVRSFDKAAALRRCDDELERLENFAPGALKQARHALDRRDAPLLIEAAYTLQATDSVEGPATTPAFAALVSAAMALSASSPSAAEGCA